MIIEERLSNILHKFQILLKTTSIFKNWYLYPLVYLNLIKKKYVIFETKSGLKIKIRTNSTDLMALTNVWLSQEYDLKKFNLKKDCIIIDIGAHIGLFALFSCKLCPNGKIFCYEPVKENFELLEQNIQLNNISNIIIQNTAVSKDSSFVKIFLDDDFSAHSMYQENKNSINVKSYSFSDIIKNNNISKCNLLKLDCEGAEYEIIDSLSDELFMKIDNIVMEYHFADSKPQLVNELLGKIENKKFIISKNPHKNNMGFLTATNKK